MKENKQKDTYSDLRQEKEELLALLLAEEEGILDSETAKGSIPRLPSEGPDRPLPLSFAQQGLWLFERREPDSFTYNVPCVFRLRGDLHYTGLQKSIQHIVQRHSILRATFSYSEGEPRQYIAEYEEFQLPQQQLDYLSLEKGEQEALRLASAEAVRPFDLSIGPLFRAQLLCLAATDHVLILVFHHIIIDGWSKEILLRELGICYEAFVTDTAPQLPALPLQYSDFAAWQKHLFTNSLADNPLKIYWQKQLGGELPMLELLTDHPRPPRQTYHGAHYPFTLSVALSNTLKELSRRQGVTLFMTLLTAFNVLLHRYTGQNDLLVGTPIANRTHVDLEPLIGFFVNMLALRTHIENNPTFLAVLQQVTNTTLAAYEHQDLPFEQLVEMLNPARDASRAPLFQVVFILQNSPSPQKAFGDISVETLKVPFPVSKFDLTLDMTEADDSITGSFEYNTDLFDAETIQRLCAHWLILLKHIARNPDQAISAFPIMSTEEQQQVVVDWNKTTSTIPTTRLLHQYVTEYARQQPDAPAVIFEERVLTYQELEQRSNQLARHLQAHGLKADICAGIYMERIPEVIVAIVAILKAGGGFVPFGSETPRERFTYMLETAQISLLLTQQTLLVDLPPHPLQTIVLDTGWDAIAQESKEPLDTCVELQHLAYVIFTSGTTGKPKGVMVEHQGLANLAAVQRSKLPLTPQSRILQFSSINFDASVWDIMMALPSGATLYLCRKNDLLPGPVLLRILQQQRISHATFPPSVLVHLSPEQLPDLRVVVSAGEALSPEIGNRWATEGHLLFNGYGPTEATVCATLTRYFPQDGVTVGRPGPNIQIYLLDAYQQPVPVGVPGEICIGGVCLARGYIGQEELTKEKFIFTSVDGHTPPVRLYRSGDQGRYRPDGTLEYLGRIDQQVKVRGFRIELGEIESLLNQHPAVRQSVLHAHQRSAYDTVLLAYILRHSEAAQLPEAQLNNELRQYLRAKVPDYMLPTDFLYMEQFPVNASGKIDHRALPIPEIRQRNLATDYSLPQTMLEQAIAECWQEVLHINQVGLHDNFFDLGGHSLLAIEVQQRLEQFLQRQISLVALFQYTTVSALAQALNAQEDPPQQNGGSPGQRSKQAGQRKQQLQQRKASRTTPR